MYLDVYIENSFLGNKTPTYQSGSHDVKAGMRVKVLMNNRELIGFVNQVYPPIPMDYEILEIIEVLDDEPVINRELFELAEWMKDQTIAPMIRCLQTILPNKLRPKSNAKRIKTQRVVRRLHGDVQGLTPTQKQFLDQFRTDTTIPVKEAQKMYSVSVILSIKESLHSKIKRLSTKVSRSFEKDAKYALTDAQSDILKRVHFNNAHTYLLHGVTGSGKTEIYLQLAHDVVSRGRQVLILVPEISLTPQMIDRVSTRFGEDVAIYHSALNDQEKYEQYMRVKRGDVNIVVGTRSAAFMPFQNLGLIVMDEEHDSSYKQENTPFYHTRDVAIHRSKYHKCPLVLGSASPRH
ncbi:DEAD/DEAH box helicase [Erysipelothrix sp. D19-032]